MHGDLLIILAVLIFGCAAFLFGLVYIVCSAIGFVGRNLLSIVRPPRPHRLPAAGQICAGPPRICPQENCRKIEYRKASYCSRCGARLTNR